MKIFVPFSEELFETAGRRARHRGDGQTAPDAAEVQGSRQAATTEAGIDDDDALGELVPFRLDYRCLRLKARPQEHATTA